MSVVTIREKIRAMHYNGSDDEIINLLIQIIRASSSNAIRTNPAPILEVLTTDQYEQLIQCIGCDQQFVDSPNVLTHEMQKLYDDIVGQA